MEATEAGRGQFVFTLLQYNSETGKEGTRFEKYLPPMGIRSTFNK